MVKLICVFRIIFGVRNVCISLFYCTQVRMCGEAPLHVREDDCRHKNGRMTSVGRGEGKLEPGRVAGGKVRWCSR